MTPKELEEYRKKLHKEAFERNFETMKENESTQRKGCLLALLWFVVPILLAMIAAVSGCDMSWL